VVSDINELAAALARAQGMIEPAPRDGKNPFFQSRYTTLQSIRTAMQEAFAANGLSVVQIPEVGDSRKQTTETRETKSGNTYECSVVKSDMKLRTILMHASGQTLDCGTLAAEVDISDPQKMGSAITYFRRYALAAISQTVSDEDDDAASVSRRKPPKDVVAARERIRKAETLEDLQEVGEGLQNESQAVQQAVRGDYMKRKEELKATLTEVTK